MAQRVLTVVIKVLCHMTVVTVIKHISLVSWQVITYTYTVVLPYSVNHYTCSAAIMTV